jgi:glycosyltransferase involved in cell wall biosynthesis
MKWFRPILFIIVSFWVFSLCADEKKTVCLNMIVKNESAVIKRCLASVKPMIDYWVIVDTGSTDGTQEMIREFMSDIPGQLYERPWINFAHNRNEALRFAKHGGDYLLFIDADEQFEYVPDFKMPELKGDSYFFNCIFSGTTYQRVLMINNHLDWQWVGVLHEFIDCPQAKNNLVFQGVSNWINSDGARSKDPKKYYKDAEVFQEALKTDPNNSRYVFYLAQSYRDAGEAALALEYYKKRAAMKGFDQEVFISLYAIAMLQESLEMDPAIVTKSYYRAFECRPTRAEPLHRLAGYYRSKGDYVAAYIVSTLGMKLPMPKDSLFVEHWIYNYGMELEMSVCAYWIDKFHECRRISQKLLELKDLPDSITEVLKSNLWWANAKIEEIKNEQIAVADELKEPAQKQLEESGT